MKSFIRRSWFRILMYGGMALCIMDGFLVEPHWIKIDRLSLSDHPTVRVVHISDIHFKGDRAYLMRIVTSVNQLSPDIVCFTGDIVENTRYLDEALDTLSKINVPLYGVPGNHEYWSGASFDQIGRSLRKTGGQWLVDSSAVAFAGKLVIVGKSGTEIDTQRTATEFAMPGRRMDWKAAPGSSEASPTPVTSILDQGSMAAEPGAKRILLTHYPLVVNEIRNEKYDLILSGHAHGGQVRLPFFGALIVPFGVNGYQLGAYSPPAGRLQVSSGLGTYFLPVRFFCRPEITVIEM